MRLFIIFLLIFMIQFIIGDDSLKISSIDTNQNVQDTIDIYQFEKFYIGFSENQTEKWLISINISNINQQEKDLVFNYVMNSKFNRKNGKGKINLTESTINFDDNIGKFYFANNGKIIFESIKNDSSTYWKVKEK